MAITINGDGTLTGISVGGLPDGIVDTDMLATDAVSAAKLQSTAIAAGDLPAGSILQVKSATKVNTQSFTSSTGTDVTGLSVSITPSSTNSKILVCGHVNTGWDNGVAKVAVNLFRDSTQISLGTTAGNRIRVAGLLYAAVQNDTPFPQAINFLDSPATTSATTYKIQVQNVDNSGTVYVNRSDVYNDTTIFGTPVSTITVMEVAG